MKKLFFFACCAMIVSYSCKKSASSAKTTSSTDAIALTTNSIVEPFNTGAVATQLNAGGVYTLTINGTNNQLQDTSQITIVITSNSPITTGTYSPAITPPHQATLIYTTNSNARQFSNDTAHGSYQPQVTITSISNTNVQGTFSGNLILYKTSRLLTGSQVTNISDGKFNVAIK